MIRTQACLKFCSLFVLLSSQGAVGRANKALIATFTKQLVQYFPVWHFLCTRQIGLGVGGHRRVRRRRRRERKKRERGRE